MSTRTSAFSLLGSLALTGGVLLSPTASAQMMPSVARQAKLYNTISVHLTAMNYFGDLVPKPSFTSFRLGATRPNLGVSFTHRFAPRVSGRAMLSYGRITADDKLGTDKEDGDAVYRYNRNLRFRNDIVEFSTVALIDLFENRGTYLRRRDFAPYLMLGVAGFYHNPKAADASGKFVALQPLGTEGQFVRSKDASGKYPKPYSRVQVSIPFGAGVNYKISRQLNLGYEIGWRKTFTDYLDDVSGKYADPGHLGQNVAADGTVTNTQASYFADPSDQSFNQRKINGVTNPNYARFSGAYGSKGSQRGTNNEKDWYIVSGFHLSYIMIPNTQSPKFR